MNNNPVFRYQQFFRYQLCCHLLLLSVITESWSTSQCNVSWCYSTDGWNNVGSPEFISASKGKKQILNESKMKLLDRRADGSRKDWGRLLLLKHNNQESCNTLISLSQCCSLILTLGGLASIHTAIMIFTVMSTPAVICESYEFILSDEVKCRETFHCSVCA